MSDWTGLDSKLFDPSAIAPETAAFNAKLEAQIAALPPMTSFPPQVIRDAREAGKGIFGPIIRSAMAVDRTIPGPAGDLPIRVFRPDTIRGVYLHLHGGGFTLGRAHHQDVRNEEIARRCEVAVVSVDYRLAPEAPYPAGPDDCEAAAVWLARNAAAEFGSDRLIIGGESAGAHLSAVTLLRLRDRHDCRGFAAANLVYGAYDLSMTPSQARWGERNLVLSTPIIQWFMDHFVPADRRRDPEVSPLYADLTGLPPALFTVGTLDPLIDDSLFMYARWIAAGNRADLAIYPGGVHAFDAFDIGISRQARQRLDEFIRAA
ncbi:MAG TPA: alpha/beta hydrolase [Dehalococcoidia bacterium]|nr:alpha/beta hydrolase [Dehalococcoidia bacterium]